MGFRTKTITEHWGSPFCHFHRKITSKAHLLNTKFGTTVATSPIGIYLARIQKNQLCTIQLGNYEYCFIEIAFGEFAWFSDSTKHFSRAKPGYCVSFDSRSSLIVCFPFSAR